MIKQYYVVFDIYPSPELHFLDEDLAPDYKTIVYKANQCVTPKNAAFIRKVYGKDSVAFFECDSVYSERYRSIIRREHGNQNEVIYFVNPNAI